MRTKTLRRFCIPILAVAAALVLLAISSGDTKAQWIPGTLQFNPILDAKLCNDLKPTFSGPVTLAGGGGACAPNTATSSNADITIPFLIPTGHSNYDQSVWLSAGGASETRANGEAIGGAGVGLVKVYLPNDPEDGTGTCGDGLDNSGVGAPNGSADSGDPDCHDTPGTYDQSNAEDGGAANTCSDGIDNGGADGADTEDPDCYDGFSSSYNFGRYEDGDYTWTCSDGIDNQTVPDIGLAPDGADAADADDCQDWVGAPGGGLESRTTLGLAANPCSNTIYPDFIWWDAVTDPAVSVACQSEGTSDRWSNMASDGGDAYAGQADANSPIVTGFPSCSAALFDPDGDGIDTDGNRLTIHDQPVRPNWRGAGLTQVPPAGDWQMLQNFEFNAGDLEAAFSANAGTRDHPFAKLPAGLGFVNVIVLNDPTTVILQPNPISDFCSVLGTRGMLKGSIDTDGNGVEDTPRITQPAAAGSYQVQARTRSYRDTDGDGIENGFDTCVWTANTAAEDPYTTSGPDTDMLDSVCDPTPAGKVDDQDGDGYLNSQDYCPLVANPLPGGETDSENTVSYNSATGVLAGGKSDGGPPQDQIGDDCDSEMGGNDLLVDGDYFNMIYIDSVCVGGTDNDQDGWCAAEDNNDADSYNPAAAEDGVPAACANGLDDGDLPGGQPPDGLVDRWDPDCNPNVKDTGGTYSIRMPDATDPDQDDDSYDADNTEDGNDLEDQGAPGSNQCGDTVDNDADTKTDSADPDCLNSVYTLATSNEEWCVGTDPLNDCPVIPGHDTWPPDFNADGVSNILDIVQLTPPVFNSAPYPQANWQNYVTRKDLNCDGTINILDIVQLTPPVFNKQCPY